IAAARPANASPARRGKAFRGIRRCRASRDNFSGRRAAGRQAATRRSVRSTAQEAARRRREPAVRRKGGGRSRHPSLSWQAVISQAAAVDPTGFTGPFRWHKMTVTGGSMEAPLKITGIDHVVLHVKDLARAKKFYVDFLGMEVERERSWQLFLKCGAQGVALFK